MFTVTPYPTSLNERVEWCKKYEKNIMYYISQIYFEDIFYTHFPYRYKLHKTFNSIYQIMKEMRTYNIAIYECFEKENDCSHLISADTMMNAIYPIIQRVKLHEKNAIDIYKKYCILYRQTPLPQFPTYPAIELDEDQMEFQIA